MIGRKYFVQYDKPLDLSQAVVPTWRDYLSLTKPRVLALLLLTTLGAMLIAGPRAPSLQTIGLTMLGGYLAAGGAGALNCCCDHDIDALMSRTRRRPLPSQRIRSEQALAFGLLLTALAVLILWFGVNPLTAVLALAGHVWYVGVYTLWLKRRSPYNIVIGGVAGAFPPLVGWAAATGTLAPMAWLLFAIIVLWTPPHFWALALIRRADYARAGVPMLPVVAGDRATRVQILRYTLILVGTTLLPTLIGSIGIVYAVAAALLGGIFIYGALHVLRSSDVPTTWRLYKYSLLYLALLFAAMVADHMLT
jgi:protoheme IX farnesyltransferase